MKANLTVVRMSLHPQPPRRHSARPGRHVPEILEVTVLLQPPYGRWLQLTLTDTEGRIVEGALSPHQARALAAALHQAADQVSNHRQSARRHDGRSVR